MNQSSPAPAQLRLHRPVHDVEIPALCGLDSGCSRFRLRNEFRASAPPPRPDPADPRAIAAVALLQAAIAAQPFGAPCRPSTNTVLHDSLPILAAPQIVIPEAPQFGDGPGVAILVPLAYHEWHRLWHPASGQPRTPPGITARLDALMLCCKPVGWAAAIPFVDTTRFKAPVVLPRSHDRSDALTADISLFLQQVHDQSPLAPDDRAMPDYLRLIHDASAHRKPPVEPPPEVADNLRTLIARAREYEDSARTSAARAKEMREKTALIEDNIAAIVADHGQGSLLITDHEGQPVTISAKYERLPARPPSPQPEGRLLIRCAS